MSATTFLETPVISVTLATCGDCYFRAATRGLSTRRLVIQLLCRTVLQSPVRTLK